MKIYMVIIYLPKMRIIKLTLAVGIVPLNKLQENDFDYKCIINDKKKINRGTRNNNLNRGSWAFGCKILETKEAFKNPTCFLDSIKSDF